MVTKITLGPPGFPMGSQGVPMGSQGGFPGWVLGDPLGLATLGLGYPWALGLSGHCIRNHASYGNGAAASEFRLQSDAENEIYAGFLASFSNQKPGMKFTPALFGFPYS